MITLPLLFLLCGQSNAEGHGITTELWDNQKLIPALWEYWDRGIPQTSFGVSGHFGPEVGMAIRLKRKYPNRQIILSKHAQGETSMDDWLYGGLFQAAAQSATTALSGRDYAFGGFIWIQGEKDSKDESLSSAYFANLLFLRDMVRMEWGDTMFVAILNMPVQMPYFYPVLLAQTRFTSINGTYGVPTHGCSKGADGLHYNTAGQLELGRRIAEEIIYQRSAIK